MLSVLPSALQLRLSKCNYFSSELPCLCHVGNYIETSSCVLHARTQSVRTFCDKRAGTHPKLRRHWSQTTTGFWCLTTILEGQRLNTSFMPCINVMPNRLYPQNSSLRGCKVWIMPFTHRGHFLYSSRFSVAALEDREMNGNRVRAESRNISSAFFTAAFSPVYIYIYIYIHTKSTYKTPEQCRL